jgi:hypothetical protein
MLRMAVSEARFPLGPPASRKLAWLAMASVAAGIVFLALPFFWAPAIVFHGAMVVTAVLAIGFAFTHRARTRPRGWVVADGQGVVRVVSGKRDGVAKFAEPFGVTVLASQARQRALLAVTTPSATRFIGVRLEGPSASLLADRASIVADGDALAAHASDAETLSAKDAFELLRIVRERAPAALNRMYLSGTRGERIVLDGSELRVESSIGGAEKSRLFDLEMPVEWRGFLFHEALGEAASIYQATWIRQGSSELVLVAPMPTELLLSAVTGARRLKQQKQLLSPAPDEPPPGDLRTGIERVFMLPVREALSRAPRPSRAPTTRRASSPDLVGA